MSKIDLNDVTTSLNVSNINNNFTEIEEHLNDRVLYRDNPTGEPNHMEGHLDMNSFRILNLPEPVNENEPARLKDVREASGIISTANLVEFTPYGNITSENVQGAIQELEDEIQDIIDNPPVPPAPSDSNVFKVGVIGDSLSQPSTRNNGWAEQFCNILSQLTGVKVLLRNVAVGGSTWESALVTKQHADGTKSQVEEIVEFEPHLLFVSLGINDLVYGTSSTSSGVINSATTMRDLLNNNLPNTKIIYAEELPHDIGQGLIPSSLNNRHTLPFSHALIVMNGLVGVRVNNNTYLDTPISGAMNARHIEWGTASTGVRTLFDGFFTVDLWKMARMGCMADSHHVDELGHTLWAWSAIKRLAVGDIIFDEIDVGKLKFSNLSSSIVDIDLLYTEFTNGTVQGNMPAQYKGHSSFERAKGWMMYSPGARMRSTSSSRDGEIPISTAIDSASPGCEIYVAWDSAAFVDVLRSTDEAGSNLQTFSPAVAFAHENHSAGTHTLHCAVKNPDGTYDAFSQSIFYGRDTVRTGLTTMKYLESDYTATTGTVHKIPFTGIVRNEAGADTGMFSRITIPASLNNRRVRLRGGARIMIPTGGSYYAFSCGIMKNNEAATGNSVETGLGLPSHSVAGIPLSTGPAKPYEFSLESGVIPVVTGDYFEMFIYCEVNATTVKAANYTWFELEVVG